jgi:hypothetical protein
MTDDDATKLAQLGAELPPIDLDESAAHRIAHRARESVGHGPSPLRFVEPVLVALFETSFFVWVLVKVMEVLR